MSLNNSTSEKKSFSLFLYFLLSFCSLSFEKKEEIKIYTLTGTLNLVI